MIMQRRLETSTITMPVPDHRELSAGTLQSILRKLRIDSKFLERMGGIGMKPIISAGQIVAGIAMGAAGLGWSIGLANVAFGSGFRCDIAQPVLEIVLKLFAFPPLGWIVTGGEHFGRWFGLGGSLCV